MGSGASKQHTQRYTNGATATPRGRSFGLNAINQISKLHDEEAIFSCLQSPMLWNDAFMNIKAICIAFGVSDGFKLFGTCGIEKRLSRSVPRNFIPYHEISEPVQLAAKSNEWLQKVLEFVGLQTSGIHSLFVLPSVHFSQDGGGLVVFVVADGLCSGVSLEELQMTVNISYNLILGFQDVVAKTGRSRVSSEFLFKSKEELFGEDHVEKVVDTIIVTTRKGEILEWDENAEAMFEWSSLDAIGQNIKIIMPDPFKAVHDGFLQNYGETGQSPHTGKPRIFPAITKSGKQLSIEVTLVALGDGASESIRFAATIRNLSGGVKAKAKLAQVFRMGNATILMDTESRIVFFNSSAESMFGWTAAEVINERVETLMPSEVAARHAGYIERYLAKGNKADEGYISRLVGTAGIVVNAKRKDATEFPALLTVAVINKGERKLFLASVTDLSSRAEKMQLQLENKALKEELRVLQTDGSHKESEIQTPLDQVIDELRGLCKSVVLQGHDRDVLQSSIIKLRQSQNLLQPEIREKTDSHIAPATRKWLLTQMGVGGVRPKSDSKRQSIAAVNSSMPPQSFLRSLSFQSGGSRHSTPTSAANVTVDPSGEDKNAAAITNELTSGDMGLDMFRIDDLCSGNVLTITAFFVLDSLGLVSSLKLDTDKLLSFLGQIERGYRSTNPYHNAVHAADVTFSCFWIMRQSGMDSVYSPLEALALVVACIVHDYDHPGCNQSFLVNSKSDLAVTYNDRSVLEQYHLAASFRVLLSPECNFVSHLTFDEFKEFRTLLIEAVLSTDMAQHFTFVTTLKSTMTQTTEKKAEVTDILIISKTLIKLADLGHCCKSLPVHIKWSNLIIEEFFRQGDKEKMLGIPVSVFCDRVKDDPIESQVGFFDFVVIPFHKLSNTFLTLPPVLDSNVLANAQYWKDRKAKKLSPPTSTQSTPPTTTLNSARGGPAGLAPVDEQ